MADVFGVPAHPLVVHAVVVLVPLAAVGALAVAGRTSWRVRYGWLVVATALADVVLVPLATSTGEDLERRVPETPLLEKHTEMGEQLLPFVVVLAAGVLGLVLVDRALRRLPDPTRRPRWTARWVVALLTVLAVVGSAGSLVQVVRIGHSGAKAVWQDARG